VPPLPQLTSFGQVRETDLSVKAAKARYSLFAESTMAANEALKQLFPYDLINASGSIESVKNGVMQQLAYQSSLELQVMTLSAICSLGLLLRICG